MASSPISIWETLSDEFAAVAEQIGKSVVAVQARHRFGASGIQWRKGVIVTAEHAVRGHDELNVSVGPEQPIPAAVTGRDPSTDLAVLKIDGKQSLPDAPLEQALQLKLGQLVLAVARSRRGNVVTSSGIIGGLSGEMRTWRGGKLDQHIRLALDLSPGFSGGPLVSAQGKVIGINTSGLARGRGLTIPISTVNRVVDELLEKGHVSRPYLGLAMQPVEVPEGLGANLKPPASRGLLVVHVEQGGPAEKSGVLIGDILITLGDRPLNDTESLHEAVLSAKIGETIPLTILRAGAPAQISIAIGERPEP